MEVIKYTPEYRSQVEALMIATNPTVDESKDYQVKFISDVYVRPYLDLKRAFILVEDGKVYGAVLAAPYADYFRAMNNYYDNSGNPQLARSLVKQLGKFTEHLPVELQIAVSADKRRQGYGFDLLDAMCEELVKEQQKGIKLEVRKDNEGAIAFFKEYGFEVVEEYEQIIVLGSELIESLD